jgi:shikimate dehydrogenase
MSNLYGLIGEKLGHSFSPQIHSLILKKLNLLGLYNLFEIKKENLGHALKGLLALEAKGINVTVPYKIDIMKYLDNLSPEAEKIGAVNTILFHNETLSGHNTDYHGFGMSLKKAAVEVKNKSVLILGTGGSSKAVVQYLIDNDIKDVVYASRTPEMTDKDLKKFKIISYNEVSSLKNRDIIINCTPCGMYPKVEACPVDKKILSNFSTAVDLIYNPEETVFLREASSLGLKTANGLYMLVSQAVAAQEIWQGIRISDELIDEIYEELKLKI